MDSTVASYRSFYWRIGVSFVLLVAMVLLLQSAFFGYWLARSNAADPEHSPDNRAARIAADLGLLLAQQPDQAQELDLQLDLQSYFTAQSRPEGPGGPGGPGGPAAFVVMKDGRTASSSGEPLSEGIRKSALAVMAGIHPGQLGGEPRLAGAFVSAPILVGNELRGLVVLPPPPTRGEIARSVGRLLSLPNTLLLIVATAIAAILIFRPASPRRSTRWPRNWRRETTRCAPRIGCAGRCSRTCRTS